jgi:hypothetical protein
MGSPLLTLVAQQALLLPQSLWTQQTVGGPEQRPLMLVIGTGLVALLLTVLLGVAAEGARTVAHEGGHAMMVVLLGGAIGEVRVNRGGGGWTLHHGVTGLSRLVVTLAGYLGPSLFGLLAALLLTAAEPAAVLWASLVLLVLLLITVRGVFGWTVVLGAGALFYLGARYGSEWAQTMLAFTWTWFLLIGGVQDAVGLSRIRGTIRSRGGKDTDSDAAALRAMTFIPAALWVGVFLVGTIAALLIGASLLIGSPVPS